jgi:hypothetical protein
MLYHAIREAPARLMLLDRIVWRDGWPRIEGAKPSHSPQQMPRFSGGLPATTRDPTQARARSQVEPLRGVARRIEV